MTQHGPWNIESDGSVGPGPEGGDGPKVPSLLLAPFMPVTVVRRQLAVEGNGAAWCLFVLAGFFRALDQLAERNMGDSFGLTTLLLMGAMGGVVGGIFQGAVGPWLLKVTSKWIGGKATSSELRIAWVWGAYPMLIGGVAVWASILSSQGHSYFTSAWEDKDVSGAWILAILGVGLCTGLWGIVNMSRTVGHANGFGSGKGFLAILLSVLVVLGFVLVLVFALMGLTMFAAPTP